MLGPKFPGVESSNAYGPQATATKVEGQRVMAAPHYRGIDIQHRFGEEDNNNDRALIFFCLFSTIVCKGKAPFVLYMIRVLLILLPNVDVLMQKKNIRNLISYPSV